MRFSTASIAQACSRHAGRTLAVWGLVVLGSIAALMFVLTGFTTESSGTNNPESERANNRLQTAFPPDPQRAVTDLVVVHAVHETVDDDAFHSFVNELTRTVREIGGVRGVVSYFDGHETSLVSPDRHATLVRLNVSDDSSAGDVIAAVQRADADPEFSVNVTGNTTRDHDFNQLSERDLRNGELEVRPAGRTDHPAARLRFRCGGPGSLADGARGDHHGPRAGRPAHSAGRAVDLHDKHADRHGPRPRD